MNIKDLEYFYQLSRLKSYTGVAQFFGVSQPTISYAIKRLEADLNCDLVEKDPSHRQVNLTKQGLIFSEHVDIVLRQLQKGRMAVECSLHPLPSVGFPPIISNYFFHQILPISEKASFLTNIHSVRAGSKILLDQLIQGKLNLSLLGTLHAIEHEQLISKTLLKKPFYFVMSADHPLSNRKSLSFEDVLSQDFILLDEHNIHLSAFKQLNARYNNQAKIFFQVDDITIIKKMLSENMGISLLTEIALLDYNNSLVKVPLAAKDDMTFYISYAYPKYTKLSQPLLKLIELLEAMT